VTTTPAIQEAHMLTGSADYLLKVVVGDLAQLTHLINDVLLPNPGVDKVHSDIVLDTLKSDNRLPLRR
jgi:DNA-binding Lrp family transcriptional regulator